MPVVMQPRLSAYVPHPPTTLDTNTVKLGEGGLLAWASGAVVVVVDVSDDDRGMRQVAVIHDKESTHAVTALDWRGAVESSDHHHHRSQCLAVGTAQGRVTVWELTLGSPPCRLHVVADGKLGMVKSLVWGGPSSNMLLVLYDKVLCAWEKEEEEEGEQRNAGKEMEKRNSSQSCWVWHKDFASDTITTLCADPADRRHVILCSPSTGAFASLKIMSSLSSTSQSKVEYRQFQADIPAGSNLQCMAPGVEGLLFLVLPKELILFDLELGVPLGSIPTPPSLKHSPFAGIAACCGHAASGIAPHERGGGLDFLVCYHADGVLTVWGKRADEKNGPSYSLLYKTSQLFAPSKLGLVVVANPIPPIWSMPKAADCSAIVVSGNGSLWKWRLPLSDSFSSMGASPMLQGSFHSLSGRATCLAAAPPSITPRAKDVGSVIGVVGTTVGTLEFLVGSVDEASSIVVGATLACHSAAVKGVAWLDPSRIVSFATTTPMTTSHSQSQSQSQSFFLTHAVSRTSIPFREVSTSLVTAMKPSWSGEYLLLLCRGGPSELWGLPLGERPQRLRAIDLSFSAVAWMPCGLGAPETERLAFALADGRLGVVAVRGRKILDAKPKLPSFAPSLVNGEHTFTAATAFSDRGVLVFGDGQGLLMLWDIATGEASVVDPGCGPIAQLASLGGKKADNCMSEWNDLLAIVSFSGTLMVVADFDGGGSGGGGAASGLQVDHNNKGRKLQVILSTRLVPAFAVDPSLPYAFDFLPQMVTLGLITRDGGVAVLSNKHESVCRSSNPCLLPPACRRLLRFALYRGEPIDSLRLTCVPGNERCDSDDEKILQTLVSVDEDASMRKAICTAFAWCAKARGIDAPLTPEEESIYGEVSMGIDGDTGSTADVEKKKGRFEVNGDVGQRMLVAALLAGCPEEVDFWLRLSDHSSSVWTPDHAVNACAQRCQWHARLQVDSSSTTVASALQERMVLEYCALGDVEAAVGYLLALPPSQDVSFYRNALMVLALASPKRSELQSGGLFDQAAKILAGNAASIKDTMVSVPLLYCAKDSKSDAVDALQGGRHWSLAGAMLATANVTERGHAVERWARHMAEERGKFWWAVRMLVGWGETEAGARLLVDAGRPDAALAVLVHSKSKENNNNDDDNDDKLLSLREAIDRQRIEIMKEIQSIF